MTLTIKTKKKEFLYNDAGLHNYTIAGYEDRENFIKDLVRKNPGILHTHIIKIAYEIVKMPTKTVETTLKRLEESKILESTKLGSRKNSITTWSLKGDHIFPGSEENVWKYFNRILTKYEKKVLRYERKLQKYCDKLYEEEKVDFIVWLVKTIWFIDWRFYYAKKLYPDVDLNPEIKRFDELKKKIFDLAVNSTKHNLTIVDTVNRELNSNALISEETFDEEFSNMEV